MKHAFNQLNFEVLQSDMEKSIQLCEWNFISIVENRHKILQILNSAQSSEPKVDVKFCVETEWLHVEV